VCAFPEKLDPATAARLRRWGGSLAVHPDAVRPSEAGVSSKGARLNREAYEAEVRAPDGGLHGTRFARVRSAAAGCSWLCPRSAPPGLPKPSPPPARRRQPEVVDDNASEDGGGRALEIVPSA
jgi:hypothetical protein